MTTPDSPHGMDPQNQERDDSTIRMETAGAGETLGPDEQALRRLLKDAVQGIEPTPDALHHLRRAVPARRAHRRQVLVGAVAAGLLAVAAVPAALHAAGTSAASKGETANASSSHSSGDAGGAKGDNGKAQPDKPAGSVSGGGKRESGKKTHTTSPTVTATKAGGGGVNPPSTADATVAACTSADLGNPAGSAGTAASDGTVYGWFKVSNTSGAACTITGAGSVTRAAQGSADPTRISVVDHTAGDAATGLPSISATSLVLQPGSAYEVQFAWIPATGGGTSGCETTTSPTPTATSTDSATSTGSADGGTSSSTPTTTDSASVVLTYTPEAGAPAASTTLTGACAGTVYKTGVLEAT